MWLEMGASIQVERRDHYLLRYTVPLAEIAGWPRFKGDSLFEALAVHWMFAVSWRRLDNVLDAPGIDPDGIAQLSIDLFRTAQVYQSLITKIGDSGSFVPLEMILLMSRASAEERTAALPSERIWERAAPFLIVPRSVLRLTPLQEAAYCDYLCADGLAHDIHDLADDLARGIFSLPASWLHEIDPQMAFRREVLENWSRRAAHELTVAVDRAREHDPDRRYRCLGFWLDVASAAAAELSPIPLNVPNRPNRV
jgi:hypothetical protein